MLPEVRRNLAEVMSRCTGEYAPMPANSVLLTSARVLQGHLELEFIQNVVLHQISLTLDLNEALSADKIIYAEYDIDLQMVHVIKSAGKRLIIFHLGDETCAKDLSSYVFADGILRNYYYEKIFLDPRWEDKIYWIPNGYKNGVGNTNNGRPKPVLNRNQFACFIGWLKNPHSLNNERFEFIDVAPRCNAMLQCIPTEGFAGGYSAQLYRYLLENSIYAPCPAGNAAETIRLFDALELGCIPVSLRHPFLESSRAMGGAPVAIIRSWRDFPDFLTLSNEKKSQNKDLTTIQQESVINYWIALKRKSNAIALITVL